MRIIYSLFKSFGFDLKLFFQSVSGLPIYIKNYFQILRQIRNQKENIIIYPSRPILTDWYDQAGTASGHYFYQDLYVANLIFKNSPVKHVDVGSRIDGFVAHVASFREIEIFDIRDVKSEIKNVKFKCFDLMENHDVLNDTTDSISCLHALEHFGLGRYGDKININGFNQGFKNISKLLRLGGLFYFSVPIGPQRIEFNAHRVFSIKHLIDLVSSNFEILHFSYVDDKGKFHENVILNDEEVKNNFGCQYGCGIFTLKKIS